MFNKNKHLGKLLLLLSIFLIFLTYYVATEYFIVKYMTIGRIVQAGSSTDKEYYFERELLPEGKVFLILLSFCFVMALWSLVRVSMADPGYLERSKQAVLAVAVSNASVAEPEELRESLKQLKECEKCQIQWKPPRAHHCRICRRCVMLMDHHCFFVDNCIGARNQKYFILFLSYAFLLSVLGATYLSFALTLHIADILIEEKFDNIQYINTQKIICLVTIITDIFFIFFIFSYLSDQLKSIELNQTLVEERKSIRGKRITVTACLKRLFGKNWFFWWLPIKPQLNVSYLENTYDNDFQAPRNSKEQKENMAQFEQYLVK